MAEYVLLITSERANGQFKGTGYWRIWNIVYLSQPYSQSFWRIQFWFSIAIFISVVSTKTNSLIALVFYDEQSTRFINNDDDDDDDYNCITNINIKNLDCCYIVVNRFYY